MLIYVTTRKNIDQFAASLIENRLKQAKISKLLGRKIELISLSINNTDVLDAHKNRLIETVLLSTHNICFGREIGNINFQFRSLIWWFVNADYKKDVKP